MLERNKYDERLGLPLWRFGQIGLWRLLTSIGPHLDEMVRGRYSYRYLLQSDLAAS